MRLLVQIMLLLVLFSVGFAEATMSKRWVKTNLDEGNINTCLVYDEVLLVGTEKGIFYGTKAYLDAGISGYPDYDWYIERLKGGGDSDSVLTNITSIAVLKDGTVYAISDKGLFYIKSLLWSDNEPIVFWEKDTTFDTLPTKLQGVGEHIYVTVDQMIYKKSVDTKWEEFPMVIDWSGPQKVLDFKVCGTDVLAKITSQFDEDGDFTDLYILTADAKEWVAAGIHIPNLVDYVSYRTFWNDVFPDVAYVHNEYYNDSSKIVFKEELGVITIDTLIDKKVVEKVVDGVARSIDVSVVSKSDIPSFYVATGSKTFICDNNYELLEDTLAPGNIQQLYLGERNLSEVIAISDSVLHYYVSWYGDVSVFTSAQKRQKEAVSIHKNEITIHEAASKVTVISINGQLVKEVNPYSTGYQFSINGLATGAYILRVWQGDKVQNIPFIK